MVDQRAMPQMNRKKLVFSFWNGQNCLPGNPSEQRGPQSENCESCSAPHQCLNTPPPCVFCPQKGPSRTRAPMAPGLNTPREQPCFSLSPFKLLCINAAVLFSCLAFSFACYSRLQGVGSSEKYPGYYFPEQYLAANNCRSFLQGLHGRKKGHHSSPVPVPKNQKSRTGRIHPKGLTCFKFSGCGMEGPQ